MEDSKSLVTIDPTLPQAYLPSSDEIDRIVRISKIIAESQDYPDARSIPKAAARILAGAEMGLGPFAALEGLHVIKGRVTAGGHILASKVKCHPKYDYRVAEATDIVCRIKFFEFANGNRAEIGEAAFTIEEASRAGLTNKTVWQSYPSDMLFNRAMSRGYKRFCPDATNGVRVYTPEEMGAAVDQEGNVVIEGEYTVTAPNATAAENVSELVSHPESPEGRNGNGNHPDWYDKDAFAGWCTAQNLEKAAISKAMKAQDMRLSTFPDTAAFYAWIAQQFPPNNDANQPDVDAITATEIEEVLAQQP